MILTLVNLRKDGQLAGYMASIVLKGFLSFFFSGKTDVIH